MSKPVSPPINELVNIQLIDAKQAAAVGSMSKSWWHAAVASGRAPQPVVRGVRCTRWRLRDVASFWAQIAETGGLDERVTANAQVASAAARAKRCTPQIAVGA